MKQHGLTRKPAERPRFCVILFAIMPTPSVTVNSPLSEIGVRRRTLAEDAWSAMQSLPSLIAMCQVSFRLASKASEWEETEDAGFQHNFTARDTISGVT
jgi:hypothetical protein